MDKYKRLSNNLIIYAIGTLGSKIISLLLVPIYTQFLLPAEYGAADLVLTTATMLMPIVSGAMSDAVLRFGLDELQDKKKIFTNAVVSSLIAFLVFSIIIGLINSQFIGMDYFLLMMVLLFVQVFDSIFSQYLRAKGEVKKFAFKGIILTLSLGVLSILSIAVLDLGVKGYLASYIAAYFISISYMTISGKLYKDIDLSKLDLATPKTLYSYSIPLVPNSTLWWIINSSSKYFIRINHGNSANGLFAVASRIPSLITMITTVFNQAWQVSAIEEYEAEDKEKFYSDIFNKLASILFLGGFIILFVIKDVFNLLLDNSYFEAWKAVPFLVLGTIFSSFSGYLGTSYVAAKKTSGALKTSIWGGLATLALNAVMIPAFGIFGASVANAIGFFIMWVIRIVDTRKIVNVKINHLVMGFNILLYLFTSIVLFSPWSMMVQRVITISSLLIALIINRAALIDGLRMLISMFRRK